MNQKLIELMKIYDTLATCDLCEEFHKKSSKKTEYDGLINFFHTKEIYLNIPSIWTDWVNRIDSKIMIVGQDWGPYIDMQSYSEKYKKLSSILKSEEKAWRIIINEKESMTKSLMTEFILRSAANYNINLDESIMDSFFVTNAVLCARKGNNYRGTENFSAKFCTENCSYALSRQIETIKPLIVITLGYWPFYSICKNHNIFVHKTLKENILHYGLNKENILTIPIENQSTYILPVYHPVAQVKKEEQISLYNIMWELLLQHYSIDELKKEMNTYKYYRGELNI